MRAIDKANHHAEAGRKTSIPQYEEIIGVVLDDKFKNTHINLYEHQRHSFEDMFFLTADDESLPQDEQNDSTPGSEELVEEEFEILSVFNIPENERLLRIVGDVGVGKSTFLKHIRDIHFQSKLFGHPVTIYTDWRSFRISSKTTVNNEIEHKFAVEIFHSLETAIKPHVFFHQISLAVTRRPCE